MTPKSFQMVCTFPRHLRQNRRNKRIIFADYFFDRLLKWEEIIFQHDPQIQHKSKKWIQKKPLVPTMAILERSRFSRNVGREGIYVEI